jgi:hypothetical protein
VQTQRHHNRARDGTLTEEANVPHLDPHLIGLLALAPIAFLEYAAWVNRAHRRIIAARHDRQVDIELAMLLHPAGKGRR